MTAETLAQPLVDEHDVDAFDALALSELNQLHEGNIARYRLRPAIFRQWLGARLASRRSGSAAARKNA